MTVAGPAAKVVVVGAGFAGLSAARALAQSGAQVTLVDRNIYSTFQPLLYQVATGGLNPGDVAYPLRDFASRHRIRFRHGAVTALDTASHLVMLADGTQLPYDYVVLATGAAANYFGVHGAAEHAFTIYTRGEAISLRDTLMGQLERLANGGGRGKVSIVVVGGGATGVEMAGATAELRNVALGAAFPELDRSQVEVVLVEQGPELLAPFHPDLRRYTLGQLQQRGVDVRLGTAIRDVSAHRVTLGDGEPLDADLTVWAAGVSVAPATAGWGLPQGRGGRIRVGRDLRVEGLDDVFATGDVAIDDGAPLPQLAQPAIQTGRHAGRQIERLLQGEPTEAFRYHDRGTMAAIGRRAAIVELPHGVHLQGTLAWGAWLGLHVVELLGNRNRVSALLNLSWRYLAWPRGGGTIVGDVPELAAPPRHTAE